LLFAVAGISSSLLLCTDLAALNWASLTFCLEGTAVTSRSTGKLSTIEMEVVREIRALRASPKEGLNASLLENPARTAHHFILDSHGNVQLRFVTIARELGVEMRTLERTFFDEYRITFRRPGVPAGSSLWPQNSQSLNWFAPSNSLEVPRWVMANMQPAP
jgi:hypothetical protein